MRCLLIVAAAAFTSPAAAVLLLLLLLLRLLGAGGGTPLAALPASHTFRPETINCYWCTCILYFVSKKSSPVFSYTYNIEIDKTYWTTIICNNFSSKNVSGCTVKKNSPRRKQLVNYPCPMSISYDCRTYYQFTVKLKV